MNAPKLDYRKDTAAQSLLAFGDPALAYFTRRDLLEEDPGGPEQLQSMPEFMRILGRQRREGCWPYPGSRPGGYPGENFDLLQTYRELGELVERYGLDRSHPAVSLAADYLFRHQTGEGDFRGIFGSQYAPHYSAGILELLIKAGFQDDPRVGLAFGWIERVRQEDGGWAWPLRTAGVEYHQAIIQADPVQSDLSRPFSHALTGFVIRAYAAHPRWKSSPTARQAGDLLKGRFFQPDRYPDRKAPGYWLKFQFLFWWGNLLTALDSLAQIGFSDGDPDIQRGLEWFAANQTGAGFWPTGYGRGKGSARDQAWVALAVFRVLKRFGLI